MPLILPSGRRLAYVPIRYPLPIAYPATYRFYLFDREGIFGNVRHCWPPICLKFTNVNESQALLQWLANDG